MTIFDTTFIALTHGLLLPTQIRIVTSALDPEINEKFYVIPGIGNFGDRYFGTEPEFSV